MTVIDQPVTAHRPARQPETISRSIAETLSSRLGRVLVYVLVLFWTVPTFGLAVSSLRPENDVKTNGWWNVFGGLDILRGKAFTIDNYRAVLFEDKSGQSLGFFFLNSLKITIPSVLISIVIASLFAYALSWMQFPGRNALFAGTVGLLVVPLQMGLVPLLRLTTGGAHIGKVTIFPNLSEGAHLTIPLINKTLTVFPALANSVISTWLAHTAFGLPLCVFIMRNFISALPGELIEAARVDGASHLTIFTKLVLPLSIPAVASLGILQFVYIWNDLLIAQIFAGGDNSPITAKLVDLAGTRGQDWHLLTSAAIVSMVLPLAVFFALQRYFVRGLLSGAVKG
jgi:alpha-glucoside transport system permease protein